MEDANGIVVLAFSFVEIFARSQYCGSEHSDTPRCKQVNRISGISAKHKTIQSTLKNNNSIINSY